MQSSENPWLPTRPLRESAALRLFCFPHAGGASSLYHRWNKEFPGHIDVAPILLPGRERRFREPAYQSLPALTGAMAEALAPHLTKPFAFFGHSMGALVAFELSRVLRREQNRSPVHLFVAAFRAPHLPAKSSPLRELPDSEFAAAIQERFGGIPSEIAENPELLALFLPALRADITAVESYAYYRDAPLTCPVMVLGGVEDRQVSAADLAAWRCHTTGEFTQKMLPGRHFFVSESFAEVVGIVRSRLERGLNA